MQHANNDATVDAYLCDRAADVITTSCCYDNSIFTRRHELRQFSSQRMQTVQLSADDDRYCV